MKDIKAKILSNEEIVPGYFKMALEVPFIAQDARPGQFVQVRCSEGFDPLLRRPLGVHRLRAQGSGLRGIELLYEVVGKGTTLLSKKQKDDFIDVLGPLGNGFGLPGALGPEPSAILVAGGIGVAPLVFLAEELVRQKIKPVVLIGAKSRDKILCEKDFKRLGAEVHIATDDGSRGSKGFISELLQDFLRTTDNGQRTTVYACGPHPMLRSIAQICSEKKLECHISVEEKMACGIGVCLGCAVKVKAGKGFTYKMACKDGPVFNADEIVW